MWAELKMNHANTTRSRGEIAIVVVALVLIGVLLTSFTTLAMSQVHKAEMRESLRQSQRVAISRCWQDSPTALAMRGCMAEVRLQTAKALDASYGLPGAAEAATPLASNHAGVSVVSLR